MYAPNTTFCKLHSSFGTMGSRPLQDRAKSIRKGVPLYAGYCQTNSKKGQIHRRGLTRREDALIWDRPRVVYHRVYFSLRRSLPVLHGTGKDYCPSARFFGAAVGQEGFFSSISLSLSNLDFGDRFYEPEIRFRCRLFAYWESFSARPRARTRALNDSQHSSNLNQQSYYDRLDRENPLRKTVLMVRSLRN